LAVPNSAFVIGLKRCLAWRASSEVVGFDGAVVMEKQPVVGFRDIAFAKLVVILPCITPIATPSASKITQYPHAVCSKVFGSVTVGFLNVISTA
jgi:hypothetical protein